MGEYWYLYLKEQNVVVRLGCSHYNEEQFYEDLETYKELMYKVYYIPENYYDIGLKELRKLTVSDISTLYRCNEMIIDLKNVIECANILALELARIYPDKYEILHESEVPEDVIYLD